MKNQTNSKTDYSKICRDKALFFLENQIQLNTNFPSWIAEDVNFVKKVLSPEEIFSTMLIIDALSDCHVKLSCHQRLLENLQNFCNQAGWIHFFYDQSLLPADVDCTSVGLAILVKNNVLLNCNIQNMVEQIINNTNEDGIIEVYAKPSGHRSGRLDAVVCVNALYFLYLMGRESSAVKTEEFVLQTLLSREYLKGTRYYPLPDIFLYFLSRLVRDFEHSNSHFLQPLRENITGRLKLPSVGLELLLKIAAANNLGINTENFIDKIAQEQQANGSWVAQTFFKYGRSNRFFGGECLSTAFGYRALTLNSNLNSTQRMR
jgi:hypothetical protein